MEPLLIALFAMIAVPVFWIIVTSNKFSSDTGT